MSVSRLIKNMIIVNIFSEYKERADDQVPLLPSYKVATELPSYEEAERTKHHLHQQEFIMEEDDGVSLYIDRAATIWIYIEI